MIARALTISPSTPVATMRLARSASCPKRLTKATVSCTPARRTAASMRSASSSVVAIGFSQKTSFPASAVATT